LGLIFFHDHHRRIPMRNLNHFRAQLAAALRLLEGNPFTRYPAGQPLTSKEIDVLDAVDQAMIGLPYSVRRRILAAAFHQLDERIDTGWADENGDVPPDFLFAEDNGRWPGDPDPD
jgi:hypothetical protein